ncbi:MAG: enoyl-CoA hydratase-related protein [Planctomycetota bacterium]
MAGSYQTIELIRDDFDILHVTLQRPEVRNAFNAEVIDELHRCFNQDAMEESLRLVILRGEGKSFSAGADLNWMKASAKLSFDANKQSALQMAAMFASIAECPVPVLALVQGAALGGGAGLLAAADFGFVADDAKIGFTEVRLGIIPSVISPFVLRKVGEVHARRYFCSGEIFDGTEAARIGLAQKSVPVEQLEDEALAFAKEFLRAGPIASREAKRLIAEVSGLGIEAAADQTATWIAKMRGSEEGQEGMAAFLDKRLASWVPLNDERKGKKP